MHIDMVKLITEKHNILYGQKDKNLKYLKDLLFYPAVSSLSFSVLEASGCLSMSNR